MIQVSFNHFGVIQFQSFYINFIVFTGCNIIPLPPKDPRAVQQLTASKPRHQRKYPLVMPNNLSNASLVSQTAVNNDQQLFCDQIVHCSCKCLTCRSIMIC